MSGFDDWYDEPAPEPEPEAVADEDDPLEEMYASNPVETMANIALLAAGQEAQRIRAELEQQRQIEETERIGLVGRQASEALREKYGAEWDAHQAAVAQRTQQDFVSGRLGAEKHDPVALASYWERELIICRERAKPTEAQLDEQHRQRILAAGSDSYS